MKAAMRATKQVAMSEAPLAYEYRNFKQDPVLLRCVMLMESSGLTNTIIKNRCGVSWTTLQNYRKGKTKRAQIPTVRFVLRAMGYEIKIEKS